MTVVSVEHALAGKLPAGGEVTVRGWVRTRRDSKAGLSFVNVSDGSCFAPIQVVAPNTLPNYESEVKHLTAGCAVIATGTLVASQGQGQRFEIQAESVEVVGWVEDPETYPIQPKAHSLEFLREVAHLRPRTNLFGAVTRIRNCLAQAVHRFFHENGFNWISTPIITTSDAEGAGQMFRVSTLDLANLPRNAAGEVDFGRDFFGKETFLTVSGQLNVEAYCLALSKVYTFGPTFRAENSNTTRHLAEFWMIEPEIAFADLAEDARLAEEFLKYLFKAVLDERMDDLSFIAERVDKTAISKLEAFINAPFERIDYTDAIELLRKSGKKFDFPVEWGLDLQTEHERWLTEEHVGRPVVVTNYPEHIKAFYMRLNDDGRTVAAMDVLAPGIGEIIGGSQREERLDVLDARMAQFGLDPSHYGWYRDFRRYGTVPHAGFGLGFERLVVYVCGLSNIRDAIPYPRAPGNAEF
ncbi:MULTISPECIES: asparagine--tRNA ligase [Pseudoxanthomonas]|uniref:Asparagine--tRNA ligase n=1 Tax=Pseudoxanthomonas winnipegensis TaxID=2480810 RepID=A0A4Q8M8R8_9GAMM|nr:MULTISPECIES: asparagine--tRNA ligase [Pseudoxanthomonas]RZZ87104.1 asparagine--tRNA ligase [Pseudoxanthomonas winnipegensis]TAA09007.1 asparagine--tRNA ligase [Pseudoxanthomonas winnipegensis]TAA20707.1 asparagine--tRNA ligase [Pseudoxanthomonas winnipegensis]TAA37688.1 asparagine--tRNA ligase [Pseudoxanthomonas winnipegensis]TAA46360.1 asparagine--tRNA ligase [Pseudoxanthomonas winnipegensis]